MAKKKQKKRYSPPKLQNVMKGLIIRWSDRNPLDDTSQVIPGKITHRNPVRSLYAEDIFSKSKDIITNKKPFMWKITIRVVFEYATADQEEDREIQAFCTLDDIDDICHEAITDAMRHENMDNYITTEFSVECLGLNDTLSEAC